MLDRIKKKIFGKPTDRSKKYWQNAAKQDIEKTMWYICDGYDKETFDKKPTGFVNLLKNYDLENKRIMDLACGIGRTCKWISPRVREYVGVDFIPEMIKKAQTYNSDFKNAKFFVNDGETLQIFEDETFDIVFCELAIQHMNKPIQESYIKEVFRVLKKNGLFFVQIPRIEFYKDENYARTKEETNEILNQFSLDFVNISDAYYTIKAEKK
jgi:ubiquinone/menaquinone biosynthesis C-methylase UbiE